MAKESRSPDKPAIDKTLRDAFKAVEAQPVPDSLAGHVDRLAAPKRRPDGRS
ncbi:hypothetical protein N0B44_21775 [Roseibacterium beibuensis]|uniref:hypothetical protein n=1 Tax=[Roseibacterium] beibuensis TaxID=1193142 RepID=UPI00217DDF5A|nr:hypothetical protein [Roseibacterium beibuensis]MCS6625545.1 hypothetical protein [Roseibacterium beibuensis]